MDGKVLYSYRKGVIHKSLALIYILASDLFGKDDKNVFKARNSYCLGGIFNLKFILIELIIPNQSQVYF